MPVPIGKLLVERGVLSPEQCNEILHVQETCARPFGDLAEELFGIDAGEIEQAWAQQYAQTTLWVDPSVESIDPVVHRLVSRRQAWQFAVLPMRYDGAELMVCTTQARLVRALNFATRQIEGSVFFVLAEPEHLGDALMRQYPMDGMCRTSLCDEQDIMARFLKKSA